MPTTRFTDAQLVRALAFFGNTCAVAEALGLNPRSLQRRVGRMRLRGVAVPTGGKRRWARRP